MTDDTVDDRPLADDTNWFGNLILTVVVFVSVVSFAAAGLAYRVRASLMPHPMSKGR